MTLGDRATLGTRGSGGTTGVVGGHGGLGSSIRKTGLDVFAVMPKVGGEVSRDRNSNPNLGMGEHCFTAECHQLLILELSRARVSLDGSHPRRITAQAKTRCDFLFEN